MAYPYNIPDVSGVLTSAEWVQNQDTINNIASVIETLEASDSLFTRYRQEFVTSADESVTITVNSGTLPSNLDDIDVFMDGGEISRLAGEIRWSVSGSVITFKEYTIDGTLIGNFAHSGYVFVKFFSPFDFTVVAPMQVVCG